MSCARVFGPGTLPGKHKLSHWNGTEVELHGKAGTCGRVKTVMDSANLAQLKIGRNALILICIFISPFFWIDSAASIFTPFSGFVDLSGMESDVDGRDKSNFRQEYKLNFFHQWASWTSLRASTRYYKFDQELEKVLGIYREELQSSGEFRLDHPLVNFNTRGQRRRVVTTGDEGVITDFFHIGASSRAEDWPYVKLGYDRHNSYSDGIVGGKDILNSRLMASIEKTGARYRGYYLFEHLVSDNLISGVGNNTDSHNLNLRGTGESGGIGEIHLTGNYNFSYRTTVSEVGGGSGLLEFANPLTGLYAFNDNPIIGQLEARNGLIDGDVSSPVVPEIDIGGSGTHHNMGADFGSPETLEGIYIYTNRPSGNLVVWEVYGSEDNFTWDPVTPVVSQEFNLIVNRYELSFPATRHRYFKAVNLGTNEIAHVNITELRFLRPVITDEKTTRTSSNSSFHSFDGTAMLPINELWRTSLDMSLYVEEHHGRSGDRDRQQLGWQLDYDPSGEVSHSLRLGSYRQNDNNGTREDYEATAGYSLGWKPLAGLRGTFSLNDIMGWQDGLKSRNILSVGASGDADFMQDLSVYVGGTASESTDFFTDKEIKTWMVRSGVEAQVSRPLSVFLDGRYQESHELGFGLISARVMTGGGISWRPVPKIFFRGAIRYNRDLSKRFIHDYLLSWRIRHNLNFSLQHYEIADDGNTTTLRRHANVNWKLSRRTRYYARVGLVDLSGSGGTRVFSFQQGFRMSF